MNHFVPDFDTTDDDYVNVNSNSSSSNLPRKPIIGEEDDLMELLWQNGQVVVQNQRLNNTKKPSSSSTVKLHAGEEVVTPETSSLHHHEQQQLVVDQNLFIQEDEMTSWLHYPLRDDDFSSDLFSASAPTTVSQVTAARPPSVPSSSVSQVTAARPPSVSSSSVRQTTVSQVTAAIPPSVPSSSVRPPVRNFMNFSRMRGDFTGGKSGPSISKAIVRESTQVNPSATPSSAASSAVAGDGGNTVGVNRKGKAVAAPVSEIHGTSSSLMSKSEIEPVNVQPETEKTIVTIDETESPSEETKQGRGTKRSRAAEVHNLSERKRRDRINERMKALQELIPRCNKSDKASMLDEAIEYLKSLQLQIQMMSMGCGMMPMMYTGMQQYMPHMAMGMGMSLGMNQPLPPPSFMPFPNMLAPQRPLPTQTHMGGGGYPAHASDPSRVYLPNQQSDPTSNLQPQYPAYMDPYQQFRSLHPTQPPQFQNQATSYPSSSRVSSSKESEDQGNNTTG